MNVRRGILVLCFLAGFAQCTVPPETTVDEADVEKQTGEFLDALRERDWSGAADRVLLNESARTQFGLPASADAEIIVSRITSLFRTMYESNPPGGISSVRRDPAGTGDRDLVMVSYRHGDLDGFYMRRVEGRWFYAFE